MGNDIGPALASACGALTLLTLFGGIALVMWVDYRGKAREKEFAHAERLKALETGLILPDAEVARANAEASRARVVGMATIFVPLGMAGAALGTTPLVFQHADSQIQLPILCVVWSVCGLVGLVATCLGLGAMRYRERASTREMRSPHETTKHRDAEAIRAADKPALPVG